MNTLVLLLSSVTTATRQSANGMETQMSDPVLYPENTPDL